MPEIEGYGFGRVTIDEREDTRGKDGVAMGVDDHKPGCRGSDLQ